MRLTDTVSNQLPGLVFHRLPLRGLVLPAQLLSRSWIYLFRPRGGVSTDIQPREGPTGEGFHQADIY